jgi:hypothetical protein
MEKIYHIYAKNKCLLHSVKEEEFNITWNTLNNMIGLMKTDYTTKDLSYEELTINKEEILKFFALTKSYITDKIDLKIRKNLWQKDSQ